MDYRKNKDDVLAHPVSSRDRMAFLSDMISDAFGSQRPCVRALLDSLRALSAGSSTTDSYVTSGTRAAVTSLEVAYITVCDWSSGRKV